MLYVANVDEDMLGEELEPIDGVTPIPICAKVEAELSELEPEEAAEYLSDLGLEKSGLETLAQAAYHLLRSEERRVGKECLRLCRSRWSPYH